MLFCNIRKLIRLGLLSLLICLILFTLLIITLFLLASLLVCLLTLRLRISIKHFCLFFHSLPILTDFFWNSDHPTPPPPRCEVNLILTWSSTCGITNSAGTGTFEITDTKLYVPVVTLSTQDNSKLLQQLKSGFKRVISWNKYLSKPELLRRNTNLNDLVETSFQGVNRSFV